MLPLKPLKTSLWSWIWTWSPPLAAMLIQFAISRSREYLLTLDTGARITGQYRDLASAFTHLGHTGGRLPNITCIETSAKPVILLKSRKVKI